MIEKDELQTHQLLVESNLQLHPSENRTTMTTQKVEKASDLNDLEDKARLFCRLAIVKDRPIIGSDDSSSKSSGLESIHATPNMVANIRCFDIISSP